jgi:hypothetical protein
MKASIKVHGVENLRVQLGHAALRVADSARKTMHRGADKIVAEAKLNTPVDEHNLEATIRKEVSYEYRGRLKVTITFGGEINGVNVDQYAMRVHENYEGMLRKGPGPGTLAKMAANPGRIIGSKFLERAVTDQKDSLMKKMVSVVLSEWKI